MLLCRCCCYLLAIVQTNVFLVFHIWNYKLDYRWIYPRKLGTWKIYQGNRIYIEIYRIIPIILFAFYQYLQVWLEIFWHVKWKFIEMTTFHSQNIGCLEIYITWLVFLREFIFFSLKWLIESDGFNWIYQFHGINGRSIFN